MVTVPRAAPCVQGAEKKPEGGADGGGPIADLFTKIEGFLSEDIVKSTQAVYQFEVTGGSQVTGVPRSLGGHRSQMFQVTGG